MHCITKNLNSNLFPAVFLLLLFSFRLPVRLLPSSLLDLPRRHLYPVVNTWYQRLDLVPAGAPPTKSPLHPPPKAARRHGSQHQVTPR
jgi:hypothetical protein